MKKAKAQYGGVAAGGRVEAEPQRYTSRGFTLIELLVVITIMGIIASMVVGMSALAGRKKRDAAVTAMKAKNMIFIETYHSKMGFYPPDNVTNATCNLNTPAGIQLYEQSTGMSSLIYELTGAPVTNLNSFLAFDGTIIPGSTFSNAYGRGGVANSVPDEVHVFYQPLPNPKDYVVVNGLKQLVVPVDLNGNTTNLWHYDCSNPNRHNPMSYDFWAEYSAGTDKSGNPIIITNGNWNSASQ